MKQLIVLSAIATVLALCAPSAPAQEEVSASPQVLVLVPERIDVEWFWYYYTAHNQHFVQTAIEKALIRADVAVVDISASKAFTGEKDIQQLTAKGEALRIARELGASHVVLGSATAVLASQDRAYGVNVFRSSAEASAKVIRVSDGKVLALEDASATEGAQSQRTAGQQALKASGKKLAKQITGRVRTIVAAE